MECAANKLKVALVALVTSGHGAPADVPRVLYRMAWAALRNAGGGRHPVEGAERDLVQDLLLRLLARREELGAAALVAEWESMAPRAFDAYVKRALRNLAVEGSPTWDLRRGLRDMVRAALEAGLPAAASMPSSLERHGRFERELVAAACAAAVASGTAPEIKALTSRLSAEFCSARQVSAGVEVEDLGAEGPDASELLDSKVTGDAIVKTFLEEEGEAGRAVLSLRRLGFKEMAKRLGTALATAHARFVRVEHKLKRIAERLGGDREAVQRAVEVLVAS